MFPAMRAELKNGKYTTGKKALKLGPKEYIRTMYEYGFKNNHQTPKQALPYQAADLRPFYHEATGQLNSTWLGHASLLINIDGYRILTDPIFDEKVSFLGPKRMNGQLPVRSEQLRDIDAVVISHDHHDHLNKKTIKKLKHAARRFLVPEGVSPLMQSWGIPPEKIVELGWWESSIFDKGLKFVCTPSQHRSGRNISSRYSTLWASWVIRTPHFSIFFSGDTGYFNGFKKIGHMYGPFDMTFLECGAYDPMWANIHMFPEECVQAHIDLKGKLLHPVHWGTFNLSLHSWYDPMQRLTAFARKKNVEVATPVSGQTIEYGNKKLGHSWWEDFVPGKDFSDEDVRELSLPGFHTGSPRHARF